MSRSVSFGGLVLKALSENPCTRIIETIPADHGKLHI